MQVLESVLPALNLAKAGATGLGIPGVEPVINGVLELATMVSTMHSNKDDLSKLENCLNTLIAIDVSGCGDNLKDRLTTLSSNLRLISSDCESLTEQSRFTRFLKSKEYKEKIRSIKDSISSHIQEFTFYGNISIEKAVKDMTLRVNNVLAKEILGNIRCASARYNAENTPDICMEGTRVDIINDIVTHLMSAPDPSQRIVMLSGSAGSGKSTIAKTIASTLADTNILAASFFFSRDYAECREIKFLPGTIARQLADYSHDYEQFLLEFVDSDRTGILSAEPYLQFQKIIVELLAKMPSSQSPWVICLDALDECGKDRGQMLLRWLSDSISQIPTHIRFFLTGRPDVPSYLRLDKLRVLTHGIILDEIDPIMVDHDIRLYVERSLDGSKWMTRDSWKAPNRDVDEITKRASGLFVFAATAVRYVLAGLPQVSPQSSVDYLLKGAPLTDLDDLYYRIVNEAISLPRAGDVRARDSRDRSVQVLGTILHLFEPLDFNGLAALLTMEVDSIRRMLLPLSAVVHVPNGAIGTVWIIHISFREFMISTVKDRRPDLLCGTNEQQCTVASNLLRIMQNELKFNICDLPTSHLQNIEMPGIQERLHKYIPTHLRYSCRFWAEHIASTSFNLDLDQEAGKCLLDKFLFWLEVLSLLGMVGHASRALSKFIAWTKDQSIIRFAIDAKRFIAFFAAAIVQSAPHIYVSALALAPAQSEVKSRYHSHFPKLLAVAVGQMNKWPAALAVLEGHRIGVTSVAISHDGKHIASGAGDRTIRVWDMESGELVTEPLEGHTGRVSSVAFSPDGKHVVSGSFDNTVRIWDGKSGRAVMGPLIGHTRYVNSVAFSPDGRHIVSGSDDKTVRIWDAESGEMLGESFKGHTGSVNSVVFSPDGKHVASGSSDSTVCVWNAESGKIVGDPWTSRGSPVNSVTFSPHGKHILSGSCERGFFIWDVKSRAILAKFKVPGNWLYSIAFSSDGKHIVSGADDETVRVWNAETGEAIGAPLKGHTGPINAVAFSLDGKIVSGSDDDTIHVWDVESVELLGGPLKGPTTKVRSVTFSPDGKQIVSGLYDHRTCLWDAASGQLLGQLSETRGEKLARLNMGVSIAVSPDGKHIASGDNDNSVYLWDAQSRRPLAGPMNGHTHVVTSVAFSHDGKQLVSGSYDSTLRIWDVQSGEALGAPLKGHTHGVESVAFSPDGKQIVSGSGDNTLRIWDALNGETIGSPLQEHTDSVYSVAFSPDGKHIVSGSADRTVRVWDAKSCGAFSRPLKGHTGRVISVAFSPDGKKIVSGSEDSTIRMWDVQSGEPLSEAIAGHASMVLSISFSSDGKRIVSGSRDTTIRIWDVEAVTIQQNSVVKTTQKSDSGKGFQKASSSRVPSLWKLHRGWVSRESDLLFWLSTQQRPEFWWPHNTLVIGSQPVKLSYDNFVHGTEWMKCYNPPASVL